MCILMAKFQNAGEFWLTCVVTHTKQNRFLDVLLFHEIYDILQVRAAGNESVIQYTGNVDVQWLCNPTEDDQWCDTIENLSGLIALRRRSATSWSILPLKWLGNWTCSGNGRSFHAYKSKNCYIGQAVTIQSVLCRQIVSVNVARGCNQGILET